MGSKHDNHYTTETVYNGWSEPQAGTVYVKSIQNGEMENSTHLVNAMAKEEQYLDT